MQILVEDITMELVTSIVCLVVSSVDDSGMGAGNEVDTTIVPSDVSVGSVGRLEVCVGASVLLGLGTGIQTESATPGAGIPVVPTDGATSVSLVVEVFSDVTADGSLVTPMGISSVFLTIVVLGTGAGLDEVVLVVMATGVVRKTRSISLSVLVSSEVVQVDVDGMTETSVVPVIGVAVAIP